MTNGTAMRTETFDLTTGDRPEVVDLTGHCERFLSAVDGDGLLNVFVPHATAGLAIIETGAGSDTDLLQLLEAVAPADARWRHRHGSPGHGRDHVLPAIVSPTLTIPVLGGRMQLGTWQSVCLVDTNGDNRRRTVRLSLLEG